MTRIKLLIGIIVVLLIVLAFLIGKLF